MTEHSPSGYEAGLGAARAAAPAPGAADDDAAGLARRALGRMRRVTWRRRLSLLFVVLAALPMLEWMRFRLTLAPRDAVYLAGNGFALVQVIVAAWALSRTTVGWQLVGRIVLLSPFVGAARGSVSPEGAAWLALFAAALIAAGRDRLDPDGGPFRPVRFRWALILAILINGVIGTVAVQRFLVQAAIQFDRPNLDLVSTLRWNAIIGLYSIVAAIGIYRLWTLALVVPALMGLYQLGNQVHFILTEVPRLRAMGASISPWDRSHIVDILPPLTVVITTVGVLWSIFRLRRELRSRDLPISGSKGDEP